MTRSTRRFPPAAPAAWSAWPTKAGGTTSDAARGAGTSAAETGHPVVQSYEPGEDWFWDFFRDDYLLGPRLAPPTHHPPEQPVPGPAGKVPSDWPSHLH